MAKPTAEQFEVIIAEGAGNRLSETRILKLARDSFYLRLAS